MKKIFVYGTLLNPAVQMDVLGRTISGIFAIVKGYRVIYNYKVNDIEYPIAIEDPESNVNGKLLDVDDDDLIKLDEYETNDYIRKTIKTTNDEEAYMYVKPFNFERY